VPVGALTDQSIAALSGSVPTPGERNGAISLHTMADKQEDSASKEKQAPPQFVVAAVELVLKVSTG